MSARSPLMPIDDALVYMLSQLQLQAAPEALPLTAACGRVLASAQQADMDVPNYDNSAMDGFAIRTADLAEPGQRLSVSQTIAAGHAGQALQPGTAARIFTGAVIPEGADAVVIQEDTRHGEGWVEVLELPGPGANIRLRGHDIATGTRVLEAGRRLQPQDLGLLASLGISLVEVYRPLTVALINTGDEVVAPDQPLGPGQLYDSNSYALEALLKNLGFRTVRLGIVGDSRALTTEALKKAAQQADCIITTGGVSVGDADHVRQAVESLGEMKLWKLAIKPGKPFSFGRVAGVPLFGLPGNPVAVFVTFVMLVRSCLLKMQGASELHPPCLRVAAGFERGQSESRQEYLRVRMLPDEEGTMVLKAFPDQGSSILSSLSWADGLAVVPVGRPVSRGDMLDYYPFTGFR